MPLKIMGLNVNIVKKIVTLTWELTSTRTYKGAHLHRQTVRLSPKPPPPPSPRPSLFFPPSHSLSVCLSVCLSVSLSLSLSSSLPPSHSFSVCLSVSLIMLNKVYVGLILEILSLINGACIPISIKHMSILYPFPDLFEKIQVALLFHAFKDLSLILHLAH